MTLTRNGLALLLLALLLALGCAAWASSTAFSRTTTDELFEAESGPFGGMGYDLAAALRRRAAFPVRAYLDSAALADARQMGRDADLLDALHPAGRGTNERLLYAVLTDSAAAWQAAARPPADSLAHLLGTLQWAAQLPVAADFAPARATLYRAVSGFWHRRVAAALAAMYRHDPNLKYSFRFRHLNQLCRAAKCGVPIGFSGPEKVLNNVVQSRWHYLYTKFAHDASTSVKLAGLAGAALFLGPLALLLRRRRSIYQ